MLSPRAVPVALAFLIVLVGCATPAAEEPVIIVVDEAEPERQPAPEPDVVEPEPEPEPQPEPEPDAEEIVGPIEVSEDLYNQAFAEVEAIIQDLNQIISRREFARWKTYLTDEYIEYHSDPEVLAEVSSQPILSQNNIRLQSLRDYFEAVVVPSRARARLDDLVFYSDTVVEAVTEFRGQRVLLYLLRKVDGEWRIETEQALPSR